MGLSFRGVTIVDFSLTTMIRLITIVGGYMIIRRYLVQIMMFLQKRQLEQTPITTTSSTSYITESELKRKADYVPFGMERVTDGKLADGSSRAISMTVIDAEEEYLNGAWGSRQRLKNKYEAIQRQRRLLQKGTGEDMGEDSEEELEGLLDQ